MACLVGNPFVGGAAVSGARLLVATDQGATAATVAARLTAAGFPGLFLVPEAALAAPAASRPGLAVVALPETGGEAVAAGLLAAWGASPNHLVLVAGEAGTRVAGLTAPPGLSVEVATAFLDVLGERDRALARLKAMTREMERRVAQRTESLARQTEALSEANARLVELDALKSGFMATVTHDLRTPLTSVLGFAKLTRREFLKEFMPFADVSHRLTKKGTRIADNLRIIENEGARLTRLVNDFLDLSKIESGRLDWHDRLVDPGAVVRMAVDAVSGEYEQNEQLILVVDVSLVLPRLRVDPDRLMQVLVNLLTNAARYAQEGEVVLSARGLASGRLEFRVSDTGPGIPEDERERIFDKFHQVARGDTTAPPRGTGLGLAICKQIVERYGGGIRAEARQPRGTVFVVELPIASGDPVSGAEPENGRQTPRSAFS